MIRAMHEEHSEKTGQKTAPGNAAPDVAARTPLPELIRRWSQDYGFSSVGIAGLASPALATAAERLAGWLHAGRHGEMDYMAKHAALRAQPERLLDGARSAILVSLPYWPSGADAEQVLTNPDLAYVSRYALGRDYHRTLRQRLQKLATRLEEHLRAHPPADGRVFAYRVFTDSAPVFEVELAHQSGVAWRGKHTLTLSRQGSWHVLGGIYTTLELPPDAPAEAHCGRCTRCLDVCPTQAFVGPYQLDARRCISYLTIELKGPIPLEFRPLLGNRIYGCDDCQLCCPWNRFARLGDPDFAVRNGLDAATLSELFAWSESEFETRLAGSPIRRIGHERWLRNLAVALGNAAPDAHARTALVRRAYDPSPLVREHVAWALARHTDGR